MGIATVHGRTQCLTSPHLFPNPVKNQYVCIHCHTNGKHDTCDTRQGECGLKCCRNSQNENYIKKERDICHQTCLMVINDHKYRYYCQTEKRGVESRKIGRASCRGKVKRAGGGEAVKRH